MCNEADQLLMKALDGFLMVLSEDGDITYVSENITELLGLHQVLVVIFQQTKCNYSFTFLPLDRHLIATYLGLCTSSKFKKR